MGTVLTITHAVLLYRELSSPEHTAWGKQFKRVENEPDIETNKRIENDLESQKKEFSKSEYHPVLLILALDERSLFESHNHWVISSRMTPGVATPAPCWALLGGANPRNETPEFVPFTCANWFRQNASIHSLLFAQQKGEEEEEDAESSTSTSLINIVLTDAHGNHWEVDPSSGRFVLENKKNKFFPEKRFWSPMGEKNKKASHNKRLAHSRGEKYRNTLFIQNEFTQNENEKEQNVDELTALYKLSQIPSGTVVSVEAVVACVSVVGELIRTRDGREVLLSRVWLVPPVDSEKGGIGKNNENSTSSPLPHDGNRTEEVEFQNVSVLDVRVPLTIWGPLHSRPEVSRLLKGEIPDNYGSIVWQNLTVTSFHGALGLSTRHDTMLYTCMLEE